MPRIMQIFLKTTNVRKHGVLQREPHQNSPVPKRSHHTRILQHRKKLHQKHHQPKGEQHPSSSISTERSFFGIRLFRTIAFSSSFMRPISSFGAILLHSQQIFFFKAISVPRTHPFSKTKFCVSEPKNSLSYFSNYSLMEPATYVFSRSVLFHHLASKGPPEFFPLFFPINRTSSRTIPTFQTTMCFSRTNSFTW